MHASGTPHKAVENGWSRNVLAGPDRDRSAGRQGSALTSFDHALPAPDSELVRDAIKDPYNFEFLGLSREAKERDLEQALLNDIQSFLMEMGRGFALVGRQFPLRIVDEETGEDHEFFIDLLFYNYLLRRFVVIDLKVEDFKPEFTGKMSFYLTAVDELERQPGRRALDRPGALSWPQQDGDRMGTPRHRQSGGHCSLHHGRGHADPDTTAGDEAGAPGPTARWPASCQTSSRQPTLSTRTRRQRCRSAFSRLTQRR